LRLVAQRNEEAGEMSVVLVCDRCSQRKILPVRWFLPWTWCFGYYPILNIQPIAYFTSMKNRIIVTCVAMSCVPLILILTGQAAPVTFTIDNSQSVISVSGLMVNFAMTPQGTGALITSYSGSINADPSGSSIQFTGGSSINAHTNGIWQPAAGGTAGSATADYGAQASVNYPPFGFILVYGALRNISFDVTSPVLPVTGGGFNGTNLVFSFASIDSALDYYSSILNGSLALTGYATNTVATGATETVNGSTRTLVIPIDATFYFKLKSANDTTVHLTGQLVATNAVAPPAPVIRSVALTNQNVVVAAQNATALSQLLVSSNLTTWSAASVTKTTNNSGWIIFTTPMNRPQAFFQVEQ
jgi:hypothetical protein